MGNECIKKKKVNRNKDNHEYTYDRIVEIKNIIQKKIGSFQPQLGLICGSGLGSIAESIQNPIFIPYDSIPHFPVSTAPGHHGRLIFGTISSVPVVCMQGRFHYYEGYSLQTCVMPIRLMKLLGITHLILSNAAGGVNPNLEVGDIMLQKDHFNIMGLAGIGCLVCPNDERFGPRFFSMTNCYDAHILEGAKKIAKDLGMKHVKEGVYTCLGGPNYETQAEIKGLKTLGIDAVGMSTVHEVTAARHCNIKCFAFSLITNISVTEYTNTDGPSCEEVLDVGKKMEKDLKNLVEKVVEFVGENM